MEAPVLNVLVGKPRSHPPAYFKSLTLGLLEQALLGECRRPGEVRFTGPEVKAVHFIWVSRAPGCSVELAAWHHCSLESVLVHLPETEVTIWLVQPPAELGSGPAWKACDHEDRVAVRTRLGARNVTVRPAANLGRSILGAWYSDPENARYLWTYQPNISLAEISDFFRILVLQEFGGLYMDLDYVLVSGQVRFIEDGAGKEATDVKRFGGHQVANSFLKFRKDSGALVDISKDMLVRIRDPYSPTDHSYAGMGGVTRMYLDHRFRKGCSQMNWTAYGRASVFRNDCGDFESGLVVGMHWKLMRRVEATCQGRARTFQLACPVALSNWDSAHGRA